MSVIWNVLSKSEDMEQAMDGAKMEMVIIVLLAICVCVLFTFLLYFLRKKARQLGEKHREKIMGSINEKKSFNYRRK